MKCCVIQRLLNYSCLLETERFILAVFLGKALYKCSGYWVTCEGKQSDEVVREGLMLDRLPLISVHK